jgi:hypothetical protein
MYHQAPCSICRDSVASRHGPSPELLLEEQEQEQQQQQLPPPEEEELFLVVVHLRCQIRLTMNRHLVVMPP